MKIPYKHLLSRLEDSPKIDEVSDKLFQLGHEHEIFKEIFDFELTPNRGDCLSLNGIIRELSIFYRTKSKQNVFQGDIEDLDLNFENHAIDICPQISFLQIEIDQETTEYKDYIESYFNDLGLNKNNFFTDISNYLSYETGQPTHCYDYKKINGKISFENMFGKYER
jgi:phenylalanyl-tRNA synthetase beta chain